MKLKNVLLSGLSLALVAVVAIGGTLAYLTDRDSEVNTFTVGDVEIGLVEVFDEANAELIPGVDIKKEAKITNTGDNDAWVWMTMAIPAALDDENAEVGTGNPIHWNVPGVVWKGYGDSSWATSAKIQTALDNGYITADHIGENGLVKPECLWTICQEDSNSEPTVKIQKDVDIDAQNHWSNNREYALRAAGTDVTFNLNGHKVNHNSVYQDGANNGYTYLFTTANNGKLTVNGEGSVYSENADGNVCIFYAQGPSEIVINDGEYHAVSGIPVWAGNGAKITINGGSFTTSESGNNQEMIYSSGGVIDIYGGFFHSDWESRPVNVADRNRGTGFINIYGGTFVNFDPSTGGDDPDNILVADGYKVVSETKANGDVWYTVVAVDPVSTVEEVNTALTGSDDVILANCNDATAVINIPDTYTGTLIVENSTINSINSAKNANILVRGDVTVKSTDGSAIHGYMGGGNGGGTLEISNNRIAGTDALRSKVICQDNTTDSFAVSIRDNILTNALVGLVNLKDEGDILCEVLESNTFNTGSFYVEAIEPGTIEYYTTYMAPQDARGYWTLNSSEYWESTNPAVDIAIVENAVAAANSTNSKRLSITATENGTLVKTFTWLKDIIYWVSEQEIPTTTSTTLETTRTTQTEGEDTTATVQTSTTVSTILETTHTTNIESTRTTVATQSTTVSTTSGTTYTTNAEAPDTTSTTQISATASTISKATNTESTYTIVTTQASVTTSTILKTAPTPNEKTSCVATTTTASCTVTTENPSTGISAVATAGIAVVLVAAAMLLILSCRAKAH